jgi:protein-S-isoprenylcysteine O-methyltransferase Ste14
MDAALPVPAGPAALTLLAMAWGLYFCLHSLLAASQVKAWVSGRLPRAAPYYRRVYNAVALLALAPPLWLQWTLSGTPLLEPPVPLRIAFDIAGLVALAAFVWTLRWYDMGVFTGLRPEAGGEGFTLSPLHRHVRHPWYFLALVVIWTRPMDAAWLVTSIAITLYLVIGSYLEDAKLMDTFGDPYRRYLERVPGLWPWPGRSLTAGEAQAWMPRPGMAAAASESRAGPGASAGCASARAAGSTRAGDRPDQGDSQ